MRKPIVALCFAASAVASPAAAQSGDSDWFIRGGVTRLELEDEIELTVGGAPVPNSGIRTKAHYTPTVQIGRVLTPNLAAALTVGLPPHIEIQGADSLAPFGKLAETTYGPAVLTLQYRPLPSGTFQPYVGAGISYMHVFSADDGSFQDVEIGNDFGPAVEAGFDIMFNDRFGIFLDAKKAFLRTEARGTFGGAPVVGNVKLDPWAFSAGVTFRF